jgi:hypothetical protein
VHTKSFPTSALVEPFYDLRCVWRAGRIWIRKGGNGCCTAAAASRRSRGVLFFHGRTIAMHRPAILNWWRLATAFWKPAKKKRKKKHGGRHWGWRWASNPCDGPFLSCIDQVGGLAAAMGITQLRRKRRFGFKIRPRQNCCKVAWLDAAVLWKNFRASMQDAVCGKHPTRLRAYASTPWGCAIINKNGL